MAQRSALLDSIRAGTQLRRPPAPQRNTPQNNNMTRPMSLMEQMRAALARRRGIMRTGRSRAAPHLNEDTSNWYYVSTQGATRGPFSIKRMKPLYGSEINSNTYFWNGTTVNQWTQLSKIAHLPQQLRGTGSSKECDYIWCCTKCNKIDTPPQICDNIACRGAAAWKLRCLLCLKIVGKENICPRCHNHLEAQSALKKAEEKEDKRQSVIFFKACNNFHTNKENMMLLVCGLVNQLNDVKLSHNFPTDIYECILFFCFNANVMRDIKDSLMEKATWKQSKRLLFSENNLNVRLVNKVKDTKSRNCARVQGSCLIGSTATNGTVQIRKVWNIEILNHVPKDIIDFGVGIIRNKSEVMYTVKIKGLHIGDIISMLYLVSCNGYYGTLSFAVNGEIKDISISEIPCSATSGYRLVIVIRNPTEIKLIQ